MYSEISEFVSKDKAFSKDRAAAYKSVFNIFSSYTCQIFHNLHLDTILDLWKGLDISIGYPYSLKVINYFIKAIEYWIFVHKVMKTPKMFDIDINIMFR